MFGLLDSVIGLTKNVADVVLAPVAVVATLAQKATEPLADAARDIVEDVKSI